MILARGLLGRTAASVVASSLTSNVRRGGSLLAFALTLAWAAAPARADDLDDSTRNAARSLAGQGKDAFDKRDYVRALDFFRRAYELVPAPTIALYEGQSLNELGRLVEAEEAFMRALRTKLDASASDQFLKAVREAESELFSLRARIPKATIVLTGPGADSPSLAVSLDGRPVKAALFGVEMPTDPGEHLLSASAGGPRSELRFSIGETEHKSVEIQVLAATDAAAPLPAASIRRHADDDRPRVDPASSWHKPAALVAGAAGVAGLATGVIAGVLATSKHETAEEQCPDRVCAEGSQGATALHSFHTLRTVSTTGYIVGGIGLTAGAALFFMAPSPPRRPSSSLGIWIGASQLGVEGAF